MANKKMTEARIRHLQMRLDDPRDLGVKNPTGNYIFPRVRAAREREIAKLKEELNEEQDVS